MRVARLRVYFIPPSQSYQSSASNVFEIVKIDGEQDDGDDEDEDAGQVSEGLAHAALGPCTNFG